MLGITFYGFTVVSEATGRKPITPSVVNVRNHSITAEAGKSSPIRQNTIKIVMDKKIY